MSIYQKDKYKFSSNPALVAMGKDITEARASQARGFCSELNEYGIILKDLLEIELSEAERNEILNIAIFISESAELYGEMEANKELPIKKIVKEVLRTRKIIDSWKEYIIAYALIIGSYKYKNLNDYLRIVEVVDNNNEDQKVIHLKDIITENEEEIQQEDKNEEDHEDEIEEASNKKEQSQEIKGVILSKSRKSAIVLTSSGMFKNILVDKESECGQEVQGKPKKSIRDHKKIIAIISTLVGLAIATFVYMYCHVISTVVIEAGTSVRLEINMLNRVVNIESGTSDGDIIIKEANVKDRDIDSAILRIIEASIDSGITTKESRVMITVTGEAIKYGVLEDTSEYVDKNGIEVKFNNAGYQKRL